MFLLISIEKSKHKIKQSKKSRKNKKQKQICYSFHSFPYIPKKYENGTYSRNLRVISRDGSEKSCKKSEVGERLPVQHLQFLSLSRLEWVFNVHIWISAVISPHTIVSLVRRLKKSNHLETSNIELRATNKIATGTRKTGPKKMKHIYIFTNHKRTKGLLIIVYLYIWNKTAKFVTFDKVTRAK